PKDSDGDGIGDLAGLIEKLDYLNDGNEETTDDLGADLIWLMPVSPSPSYHGYDVTDYRGIHPDYGTLEDMKKLVAESHARGIRIIVDLVLNHSSSQHPWFVESKDRASEKRSWYVWSDEPLEWGRPWGGKDNTWHKSGNAWYYGLFWSGMPDLNYTNPAVRAEMTDVGRWWLSEVGVDGYRLDAVRYLVETGPGGGQQDTPETLALWKEFAAAMQEQSPDVLLIGEAWASNSIAAKYRVDGQGLQLTFDFDLMEALSAGVAAEEPADIEKVLCLFPGQFPPGAGDATFLTNHDLVRLSSRLKEDPASLRLAAMLLMTLPGTPFLYYGEEIGMPNGATLDDTAKRLPMAWSGEAGAGFTTGKPWKPPHSSYKTVNVAAQKDEAASLLSLYRDLIRLRRNNPAVLRGGFLPLPAKAVTGGPVWAFRRTGAEQDVVVAVNFGTVSALEAAVDLVTDPADSRRAGGQALVRSAEELWPDGTASRLIEGTVLKLGDLEARSVRMVEMPK
ncbi:MAG: DUF3459 domain-containing protein, partial [Deltaproteobacteria bacterium]|nr:DUF3459 domain-containing protein [Deltaproteobacteria bacterium]